MTDVMEPEYFKTCSQSGTVIKSDPENRTYPVNIPHGTLRRNRRHLQQLPLPQLQPHTN